MIPTKEQIEEKFRELWNSADFNWNGKPDQPTSFQRVLSFIHTIRESDRAEVVKEIREWAVNHSGATRDECQNEKVIPTGDLYALLAVLEITKE